MKAESNRIRKFLDGNSTKLEASMFDDSTSLEPKPKDKSIEPPLLPFDVISDVTLDFERRVESDPVVNNVTKSGDNDEDAELEGILADILDDYLEHLENGTPIGVDDLVNRYPQYEQPLRDYLAGLNLLNAGIAEMSDSPFRLEDDRQTLGDYELIREIGRGGMGVVYEARQISLDRPVALKVLPFAAMLDQRQIARFEIEARAAARLQHPHIVPVYGVGCDCGVHYYAMQYIEGSSVRELIDGANCNNQSTEAQDSTITPRHAARLGLQAASALHAAHTSGVVHRDIKPSNLLLDANDDLWVADFGLARSQASDTDRDVTKSGDVLGTLHYMSPEQACGNSAIADPRSDIYSLGVTLYELLTRQRPFSGDSHGEILQQIELGQAQPMRSLNPEVPRDLENVVSKAMSVEPSLRYQSAEALEDDLRRFMDGRATLAKPPSLAQRLSRWAARNRSIVVSTLVVLLVVLVALACSTFWLAGERAVLADQRAVLAAKHQTVNHKLQATETTLETFGLATAERMKQIPGSKSARKALLAELLTHYEELLDVSQNESMRADRAITSTKIANIHRESGELPLALQAYRDAEADFLLLTKNQRTTEARSRFDALLAKCQSNMSVVLLELGKLAEATEEVHDAIQLQTKLNKSLQMQNAPLMMDLAASYANFASIKFRQSGTGLVKLNKAVKLAEAARQVSSAEEISDVLSGLSAIYARLSSQLRKTDLADATEYARRAVGCTRELIAHHQGFTLNEIRGLHAVNCNNLASLYFQQDAISEAMDLYTAAATQLEKSEDHDRLVRTLVNLAKAETAHGSLFASARTYGKAITIQSSLLLESPGNLNYVSRLGGLYNNRALALLKLGKGERACVAYESAVEYQQRAYQLAPKSQGYYRDALSRTFFNAGKACMQTDKPLMAAELQMRRSELWPHDAKQLFSVARNIAAAIDRMPRGDAQRPDWAGKASSVLDAASQHDNMNDLDKAQVSNLRRYLSNVVGSSINAKDRS